MKETASSLRAYFILAGLLSAYSNGKAILESAGTVVLALRGLSLLAAVGFLYAGAVLPMLLVQATERIYVVLAFSAACPWCTARFCSRSPRRGSPSR
jgi:hypothetical protein